MISESPERRPLVLLLDGHAMVFRAWFSIPERLSTAAGIDTRGAYGFLNTFLKVIRDRRPTHVAVAFDTSAPTFRDAIYAEYKAHRPPTPDDLHAQVPMVKRILEAFRVPVFEIDGFEADDIVGTISRVCEQKGVDVLIVTGDADQLQLVSPTTKLLMYTGFAETKVYDVDAVKEKYGGLGPECIPDIKAITGDPSDNIPGIKGLGDKAAVAILTQLGTIENAIARVAEVEKIEGLRGAKRARTLLEEQAENALRGKKLTTIIRDAPVPFDLDRCVFWRYDRGEVVDALLGLEFRSVIAHVPDPVLGARPPSASMPDKKTPDQQPQQLGLKPPPVPPASDTDGSVPPALEDMPSSQAAEQLGLDVRIEPRPAPTPEARAAVSSLLRPDTSGYSLVTDHGQLEALVSLLRASTGFAFDTETTDMDPMRSGLVGLSFAVAAGQAWYVPVGHVAALGGQPEPQLPLDEVLGALRPVFEDPAIPKTAHNANFDLTVLGEHGIIPKGMAFDSMIAAALVGRRAIGLKELALEMFRVEMTPITDLIGSGRKQITMDQVPVSAAAPYASADADFAWRVQERLRYEVDRENQQHVLFDIEMPLLPVIVSMQRAGVLIDRPVLSEMSELLGSDIAGLQNEASSILGGRGLNLNANQQIAAILFDELRVPRTKRTKTGYTMDAPTLEGLLEKEDLDHRAYELIKAILRYREYAKLKSTYVDALPDLINPKTNRVHTSFNQVGSATGRLSSTDPNVQNIPVRTELGKRVRSAFVADHKNGWTLLAADYSQIELRILAHLSQEPHLLEAFRQGEDIHAATARAMYNVEKVSSDQRRIAKILNFGVIYGLGAHGVAVQTDLSRAQGQQFIDMYFGKYPGVREFIARKKAEAHAKGYAETVTGRRRRLPELRSPNQGHRAAAERVAVNMPIQGTAADIIKIAMIQIDAEMAKRKLRSRMIIQVHDELIFEVAPGELDEMRELITTMMPAAMALTVPLTVETKNGVTWGDME